MTNSKELRLTVILAGLFLLAFLLLPETWIFSDKIVCPTRLIFHFPCPLCGFTRSAWLFVHLRWAEAWELNAGIFPLFGLYLIMLLAAIKGNTWLRILRPASWACIALILFFYIFRVW